MVAVAKSYNKYQRIWEFLGKQNSEVGNVLTLRKILT